MPVKDCLPTHERIGTRCLVRCASDSTRGSSNRCKKNTTAKAKPSANPTAKPTAKAKAKPNAVKECPPLTHELNRNGNCVLRCPQGSTRNEITLRCNKDKKDTKPRAAKTKKMNPVHVSPARVSPFRVSPTPFIQFAPPRDYTPAHFSPVHVSPIHISPDRVSPAHVSPAHVSPAHVSPAHISPTQAHVSPKAFNDFYTMDDDKVKNDIVIDKQMRDYLMKNHYTNEDDMKAYIKDVLTDFKYNKLSKDEIDFVDHLRAYQIETEDIYKMTPEDLIQSLESNGDQFASDYVVIRKYKMPAIKKLLDRIKFFVMRDDGVISEYAMKGMKMKKILETITKEFKITVSPSMAHYIKHAIKASKQKSDGSYNEDDYQSKDSYSGKSYGLVGKQNKKPYVYTGRRGVGRFGNNMSSESW
jgi:hypothetical protein